MVILLLLLLLVPVQSWSAVAFVKASTQGSCSGVSSCASSFASLPSSGNGVIVAVGCWNSTADCNVTSITDNQGNTYSLTCQTDTLGNSQACIGRALSIGSPSGTYTVTANAVASTYFELIAMEYTATSNLDVTKGASYVAVSTANTGVSAVTSQSDELSVCVMTQSSSDTNINVTTPAGYTRRGVQQNAGATIGFEVSDKILTSTGTQQCAWSHDTVAIAGWAALLQTFTTSGSIPRRRGGALFFQ